MSFSFTEGKDSLEVWRGGTPITVRYSSKLQLLYLLSEAGWADLVMSQKDQCCIVAVSYLHDSLRELLDTACVLTEGSTREIVHFYSEPGMLHLVLEMEEGGYLSLTGKCYLDEDDAEDDFEICFKGRCKLRHYVKQVLASCAKILKEDGEKGYLKKWELHSFPAKAYLRLKDL